MSYRDIWKTQAQLADIDAESIAHAVQLNIKDRGTPFQPIGPSRPVRRGATWEGCSEFIRRAEDACRRLA